MHSVTPAPQLRQRSKDGSIHVTDEFYNTLISAIGALLSLIAVVVLVSSAILARKPWHIISFFIYGSALILLFTSSALHHGVDKSQRVNHFLREMDYYAIFLMIAGTFTPFCLILLRNPLGWSALGLIWFLAILGIVLKIIYPRMSKWLTALLYLGMGWSGALIGAPIYQHITDGIAMVGLGGIFFTVGAVIYYLERPNPVPGRFGFHEIWHLFVVAGAASHFAVMYFYLLPYS